MLMMQMKPIAIIVLPESNEMGKNLRFFPSEHPGN